MDLLPGGMPSPEEAARLLGEARACTLRLIEPLTSDELRAQHDPLMSPMIWDIGHIGHFEEVWLLEKAAAAREAGSSRAGSSAAAGGSAGAGVSTAGEGLRGIYNPFENPRATRDRLPLPTREEALRYLEKVREAVLRQLPALDFASSSDPLLANGFVLALVLQHEYQHNETLLQTLQLMKGRPYPEYAPSAEAGTGGTGSREICEEPPGGVIPLDGAMVRFPGGDVLIGTDDTSVAYDNERPLHRRPVEPFWIDATPVTNAAFLRFIEEGGYRNRELWSDSGWEWLERSRCTAPGHWTREGDEWRVRIMGHERPLRPHAPVCHVCYFEAEAYARFAGRRLPTEFEWEAAATWNPESGRKRLFPWGDDAPAPELANLDSPHFDTLPVDSCPDNVSPIGCSGMIGDVWEWTSSDFEGYPGFRPFPYREYSEVFFGSEYKVLRGGSWATRPGAIRGTFRNWDFPIRRQIFSGFRCARDD